MKKTLFLSLLSAVALSTSVLAEDAKPAPKDGAKPVKRELTPEQAKLRKEITAKYDTNKDGKLDKEERAAISEDDKAKMKKAGLGGNRPKKTAE